MNSCMKFLIIISFGVILSIFTKGYYCSAKTLDTKNQVRVTGKIMFSDNIENNIINKDDVQGTFPVTKPYSSDKHIIDIPKTCDTDISIYLIILILATFILIWQYRKPNEFEKEVLINEKKDDSID